jgi:hypothetical protein
MYLRDKNISLLESFGKTSVFPGSIEEIPGKGRGVIATRDIKKHEIVANYPGKLITQAEIFESYQNCKYIFSFQDGPTPFTSWAIIPVGVANLGIFINHGKPNVAPSRFWSSKGPIILFISLRKINMGEEILYDYGPKYSGSEHFL